MAAPIRLRSTFSFLRFHRESGFINRKPQRIAHLFTNRTPMTVDSNFLIIPSVRIRCLSQFANARLYLQGLCPSFDTSVVNDRLLKPSVIAKVHTTATRMCSTSASCWNCNAVLEYDRFNKTPFFCTHCNAIQPVQENISHFQRMSCEMHFDLDTSHLQKFFRLLQSKLHPDKFSQKSEIELSYSADQSSAVNKAYRTLLHPLSRGLYMLELAGAPLEEGDSTVDPSFLMEIMEINETLAELDDLEEVKKIWEANSEKLQTLTKELSWEFDNKNYEKAREVLMRLKYYANIDDKVKEKLGTSTV